MEAARAITAEREVLRDLLTKGSGPLFHMEGPKFSC